MNSDKKYPHLPDEDNRLRLVCFAALTAEYGENPEHDITERLEKELSAIAVFGLSSVLLILREMVVKAGLKKYELANRGTFGTSFVAWLCGLTPYNPLKAVMSLYPEFCFGLNWDRELSVQISVPDGKAESLFETLKGIDGVGDIAPLFSETEQEIAFGRCIIPVGEKVEHAQCVKNNTPYFELMITTLTHLRLLERCVELTGADPALIRLDDKEVLELFKHTGHPACLEISPYRLSAIGLFGFRSFQTLILYGNAAPPVRSFADLVRIEALMRSEGAWNGNQEDLVYDRGVQLSDLITCREDVFEFCRFQLGMEPEDAFAAAERVRKGCGIPDDLEEKVADDNLSKLKQFKAVCDKITYLWPRVHSYGYMLIAWRCAWYRLHYPVEFYQAYFEIVANPQITRAVFSVRKSYDRLTVYQPDLKDPEFDRKFDYDVDLAVADEMYFRGIDLTNVTSQGRIPDGVERIRELILPGQITVIAGRPGTGKTSLACDLIGVSDQQNMSAYITLFESPDSIVERISKRGRIPCSVFSSVEFALDSIESIRLPVPLLVLDGIPYQPDEDYRELFERLKAFAEKHHAPVIVISQVSGAADTLKDKRPRSFDFPIASCLDIIDNVVILYHKGCYECEKDDSQAEAIIAQSPPRLESIPLRWDHDRRSFL